MNNGTCQRHYTLTQAERHILYLVLVDASASVTKLASVLGCRPHVVQAAYTKFRTLGLISRRVMIDTFRLGYSHHLLLLNLSPEGQRDRNRLTQFLIEHPNIAVVQDVAGDYDLLVHIIVRSPEELSTFQDLLTSHCTSPFRNKDLSICLQHSIFGEKSLAPEGVQYNECSYQVTSQVVHIDTLDRQLLFRISNPAFTSLAQLSREINQPFSTIDYRVKKLRERGILCGDLHELQAEHLSLSSFILLVSMKGLSNRLRCRFHDFAKRDRYITHLSHMIGTWDFTLWVSVPPMISIQKVTASITERFGTDIAGIESLTMSRTHKMMDFPFDPRLKPTALAIDPANGFSQL